MSCELGSWSLGFAIKDDQLIHTKVSYFGTLAVLARIVGYKRYVEDSAHIVAKHLLTRTLRHLSTRSNAFPRMTRMNRVNDVCDTRYSASTCNIVVEERKRRKRTRMRPDLGRPSGRVRGRDRG